MGLHIESLRRPETYEAFALLVAAIVCANGCCSDDSLSKENARLRETIAARDAALERLAWTNQELKGEIVKLVAAIDSGQTVTFLDEPISTAHLLDDGTIKYSIKEILDMPMDKVIEAVGDVPIKSHPNATFGEAMMGVK